MTVITAAELAAMRATAQAAMPDLATIQRAAKAKDGQGGWTATWSPLATNVACVVDAIDVVGLGRALEEIVGERLRGKAGFYVSFPSGQDVTEKDRIVVNGRTLEVLYVEAPESWELTRVCVCMELR